MPLYDCGAPDCEECQRAFGPDRSRAIANYHERERQYAELEKQMPKDETPPCRTCKNRHDVICYPDDHSLTICPDCCAKAKHPSGETGHVFEYDRDERDHVCAECGILRSCTDYDYSDEDGGGIDLSAGRPKKPYGTPISQLSGRPGHPGYEEFCRIAKSWGYE